jgi:hypothetical protein
MAEGRELWARWAAAGSVLAPVVACGFGLLGSRVQTRAVQILLSGVGTALILAGFLVAIAALSASLRQGRKGSAGLAGAGVGINGLFLLGLVLLIPALSRVAQMRNAGYTLEQMQAMPRVIPDSREILNEDIGFRLEVPGDFMDNPQPLPPHVLYSFLHADANGLALCVNVERLGGQITKAPLTPEFYAGLRRSVPPDAEVEQAAVPWKTHQLDAFRVQYPMGGRLMCAWSVQVPLAKEAIQIGVGGQAGTSEEYRRLLEQLLTGLAGISNWDPPSVWIASGLSLRPGPRASQAAEPAPPVNPSSDPPAAPPAEPAVAPGHSEIRTFVGEVPEIPDWNSRLNYEFDLSREPVLIHVPANYDGSTPFGLIVFLPGDGPFTTAPRGWETVLEQRKLLFVSPQKALNSRDWDRRCALAVVCALKMREQYRIDPRRVYAAGYSGGARMASRLGFYHADLFSGTIQSCGSDFHRPVPAVKTVPLARDRRSPYGLLEASAGEIKAARQKVRFVLITGPGDFRYGHLLDIYEGGFTKDGFQAKLIDDPWMAHETCGPVPLSQALDFIEQGRDR